MTNIKISITINIFADGYETNQMILEWLDEAPVEVAEDLQMPQFDMYAYNAEGCVHKYKTGGCLMASRI